MGKNKSVVPVHRFTRVMHDKQRLMLAELPDRRQERLQSITARNEMLAATQAYQLKLERDRVQSHITLMPASLQRLTAEQYVGNLEKRIHHLGRTGLP